METLAPPPSTRLVAPRPARGGTTTPLKNQPFRTALRKCAGPLPNGMGISFQRLGHRRRRPTLRQQPNRVPSLPFPRGRRSLHPLPYPSLVPAPLLQQRSHLRHAQQPPQFRCQLPRQLPRSPPVPRQLDLPIYRRLVLPVHLLDRGSLAALLGCVSPVAGDVTSG